MNDRSGLCVPKDGSYEGPWGTGIGAGWYRFSGDLDLGMSREVAQAYVNHGLQLFLTLDSDSFRGRTDERAVIGLAERYHGLITIVGVGNEPDGTGGESSRMTHARINRLMEINRYYWGDNQWLASPGLISGNEDWLDGFDFTHCNFIDVHWYGQWAPGAYPGEGPIWGYLPDIMDRYVKKGKERSGRFVPLVSSESGLSTGQVSQAVQAQYVGSTVDYCLQRTDVLQAHMIFAFHDHDGFGIINNDGTWKEACWAYMAAANGHWTPNLAGLRNAMRAPTLARIEQWQGKVA